MKFTIGIPAYKQANFLLEALESALDQTVPCEIIVVNDGSPDSTLEYAKSYEKKGVKVIDQVNKGLSSARNTAIMNMTGDYFLPLDADDILLPHAVEVLNIVAEDTGADIISPSFQTFGLNEAPVILMPSPTIEDFKTGNRVAYCSAIKREALLEVGGYSPRMTWGYEDLHLWFDLLKRGKKLVTVPEILFKYRVKKESMITESIKHHDELLDQIEKDHGIRPTY